MVRWKKWTAGVLCAILLFGCMGCGEQQKTSEETIVIRILENDTAKKEGYLDALLAAFNEAYKDKGIQAVDANMEEYTDLAANGPYGYGPDVLYQANDKLMTYAEDKHILPIDVEKLDCYVVTSESAWEAFKINIDGKTYTCGVPVNIQEPMLFYRLDQLPKDWETNWDKDKNKVADFFENWNDLYAYSAYLRENDSSPNKNSQYGFMSSLNNLYLNGQFLFSYGAYVFGSNADGTLNAADVGLSAGEAANGLMAMKQMAALMNEGCIDDTITMNRYEKLADGTYFCAVSTPDTYSLFIEKLALTYESEGFSAEEAEKKAVENLMMVELPGKLPADGDLKKSSASMAESDWVDTVVMGGVNGYGISSYTKYKDACLEFVNFATGYEMIQTRMNMLGIAPTRSDVAGESGGVTDMIFKSLSEGRIYLMPSIKAVDQIWVPAQTLMGDVAKDPYRTVAEEAEKYAIKEELLAALKKVDKDIYDAVFTLKE